MNSDLSEIQRWMQAAIAGEQGEASLPAAVDDVILPSTHQTGAERLAIYQHAYLARLLECMQAEFPLLSKALDAELFRELATGYLVHHPPTSYTLAELGRAFPDYLKHTHPQDDATGWFEAMAELAALEWVTAEVYQGPGTEQSPPLNTSLFTPENWHALSLSLSPCVRLLEFDYPVHEYYRALREDEIGPPPAGGKTNLVVSRLNYTVRHNAVSPALYTLLSAFERQATLMEAIIDTAEATELDADEFTVRLHEWFRWLAVERLVEVAPSETVH
jgi:hypothetical protein